MEFSIFVVDAFTSQLFCGNPAAVCLVPYGTLISETQKQLIATEMRHAETAFVQELSPDLSFQHGNCFKLQWFTPTCEVTMCGHATLATAYVLYSECSNKNNEIQFQAKCGKLLAKQEGKEIILNFPIADVEDINQIEVLDLLNIILKNDITKLVCCKFSRQTNKLLIRVSENFSLESLEFEPDTLMQHTSKIKGVIITRAGNPNEPFDFYSRYFSPWNGVGEDPVTGSSHTVLGAYWGEILNKSDMLGRQCSKRGGNVRMKLLGDGRICLSGEAKLALSGKIKVS